MTNDEILVQVNILSLLLRSFYIVLQLDHILHFIELLALVHLLVFLGVFFVHLIKLEGLFMLLNLKFFRFDAKALTLDVDELVAAFVHFHEFILDTVLIVHKLPVLRVCNSQFNRLFVFGSWAFIAWALHRLSEFLELTL